MESASADVIAILRFLLPGFIAAWVFHGLTPFPKPGQFERVVHALILTMLVQVLLVAVEWLLVATGSIVSVGRWAASTSLVWSVVLAFAVGLFFSRWANNDTVYRLLRESGFTKLNSYPSEWFFEFSRSQTYVVLHLAGERRLYGWPEQWPSAPDRGEFSIADAEWLVGDRRVPLAGVANILVPVDQVEMVEFMGSSIEE